MKKLNRKGFTLIELLAVIVILAIILVVTVPNIISSINDARVSSIHNLAVRSANTYNQLLVQDSIATTEEAKKLGTITNNVGETWKCIGDLNNGTSSLADILELKENDLILKTDAENGIKSPGNDGYTNKTCSAIRINNGKTEIVLVAKAGGKFALSGKTVYALNTDSTGTQK